MRRQGAWVLLVVLILAYVWISLSTVGITLSAPPARPNIVVIMTDDQDMASLPVMRKLNALAEGAGWVRFDMAFANDAKCCPSRATFATGQWSHHHGVTANGLGYNLDDANTLPVWLKQAGYSTYHFGKYYFGFPWDNPTSYQPPGWDGFDITRRSVDKHTTQVVTHLRSAPEPFYTYLAYFAPHVKAQAPARYADKPVYIPPYPPNFNEADVEDKPLWVRRIPPLVDDDIESWADERANSQREILAIDDGVQAIWDALDQRGILDNTIIIFIADQGFSWGSHRWWLKNCAYLECSLFPLYIYYPGAPTHTETRLVSNADMAPTLLELSGATSGRVMDGMSILPLLMNTAGDWRETVLLERHEGDSASQFYGIQTDRYTYVEYLNGDKELYDLEIDPYQLQNEVGQPAYASVEANLAAKLYALLDDGALPTLTPTPETQATPTPTPTRTPTPSPTPTPSRTPTPSPTPAAGGKVYLSSTTGGTANGVRFADEDILVYYDVTGQWSLAFDGSDVGLAATDVDAFHLLPDGRLLLSLDNASQVPGIGLVDDSDVIAFTPSSLGSVTAGSYALYFDGSDVGLSTNAEDVDALAMTADGDLLLSTLGNADTGTVVAQDEDLLRFSPGQLGETTIGQWSLFFDGSTIGLTLSGEDIFGAWLGAGDHLYLSTMAAFAAAGVSGGPADVFSCGPVSSATCDSPAVLRWRGAEHGFGREVIDALHLEPD